MFGTLEFWSFIKILVVRRLMVIVQIPRDQFLARILAEILALKMVPWNLSLLSFLFSLPLAHYLAQRL